MGHQTFSTDSYHQARRDYGVTQRTGVTKVAEERARVSGQLSAIVDPAIEPIRRSMIRLDPHDKKWIVTVGCPIDIEVSCDTTASMGGEVDNEMEVLPDLYGSIAKVLHGYDPQLCLGIFGDYADRFVLCRPQFEMEAPKIVNYLKEMAPQRGGGGNHGEDPQYAMLARAYLTDAYTNRIGLKGYHFVVTDEPCHRTIRDSEIRRIFGENIFDNELKALRRETPNIETVVSELKSKTHAFALLLKDQPYGDTFSSWVELYGAESVIVIESTRYLPVVISAIIGLCEGSLDITDLDKHLRTNEILNDDISERRDLVKQLSKIQIGAQAKLRHTLPHPVPKKGDVFASKGDLWPIQSDEPSTHGANDEVRYL